MQNKDRFSKYEIQEPDKFEQYASPSKSSNQENPESASFSLKNMIGVNEANPDVHHEPNKHPWLHLGADLALTSLLPMGNLGKLFPGLSKFGKGAATYGGDIAQNAGWMAGLNAMEGESPGQGALAGGAGTAIMNPLVRAVTSSNPLLKIGAGATLGGGAAYLGGKALNGENKYTDLLGVLAGGYLGMRGKNAQALAQHLLLKGIEPQEVKATVDASKRLGLKYITPGEATGNRLQGPIEARVGTTEEGAKVLQKKEQERLQSESSAIKKFLNKIATKKQQAESELYYKKSQTSSASPQFVQNLKDNSIIDQAFKNVKSNSSYKSELHGVPEENFKYLDYVKKALDDMRSSALRAGNRNEARLIKSQKDNMLKEMDKINPDYAKARQNAQRVIKKREMMEKIPNEQITGSAFYKKFLENDNTYNKLYSSLKHAPEAQKMLADMRISFKNLSNPMTFKTAKGMGERHTSDIRNPIDALKDFVHKAMGKKYDTEAVNLMTNPDWINQLGRNTSKQDETSRAIANILSRGTALPFR
jgi:hypothetical protein